MIQLKSFLSVLRLALQGKSLDNITLSSLAPASSKNLVTKTSLVILSKREYPLTSNFPSGLESLQVRLVSLLFGTDISDHERSISPFFYNLPL